MRLMALAIVCAACIPARPRPQLVTFAEQTDYKRTGRYDEAVALCRDFARAYDGVTCETIGATLQQRPIVALRVQRRAGTPYVMVQGGIHAGEIEGKDAGFAFLRDLLDGKVAQGALDHVSIVFVPVINPDGHERFGPNNRPNQRGPVEMGFRTNGARLNLNRDWVKADAPETQAVLRVLRERDPVMFVDLHTTDGAQFEHDISVTMAPFAPRADSLDETTAKLQTMVMERLTALGHLPLDFYPSFVDDERPHSGFGKGEAPPRFNTSYMAARGRIGVLVETHSWRSYKERAKSTYHTLQALFEDAVRNADSWVAAARDADAAKLAGTDVTLMWKTTGASREIDFRGYAYERRVSDLTGGTWLVYDETTPETWRVPLFDTIEPAVTIKAPARGYIVDGGFAAIVAAVLDHHGIRYSAETGTVAISAFRASSVKYSEPYEGRTRAAIEGAWTAEKRTLDRGAIFVPIDQPKARLIMHLLEPSLPDSLAAWGAFNTAFEPKEYAEPYVLEQAAREMFARDPELAAAFAAFAVTASTEERLAWIYRHHASWDERLNLLPVYRAD